MEIHPIAVLFVLFLISGCNNEGARKVKESPMLGTMAALALSEKTTKEKTGRYSLTLMDLDPAVQVAWDIGKKPSWSCASGKIHGYRIKFIDGPKGKADLTSEFFMTAYPETTEAGVSTFLLGRDGGVWRKNLSGKPAVSFPEGWEATGLTDLADRPGTGNASKGKTKTTPISPPATCF